MKIFNFGSLNYDYVYSVDHILMPGETLASSRMETFCGGKGLNQSVALAKAGAEVWHAGMVGEDGSTLLDMCGKNGVNTSYIRSIPGKSGHTVIQVDKNGQNNILLFGGSNRCFTRDFVDEVFSGFEPGDMMLLQNEVNDIDYIIDTAYQKGMRIAFNPSPFDEAVKKCDLNKVSFLLLNEIEGWQISGAREPEKILKYFAETYPKTAIVLTLGKDGAVYQDGSCRIKHGIYPVKVVDTTAAGDTFTGFFLSAVLQGKTPEEALEIASKASSIAVTRKGAAPSIPTLDEVLHTSFD
ncbi:MAG TPA: ribokinase [Clostridiales bacterium]|nr:ribokinase [Clostridiales bacterium]